jgi:ADP-heptose:LPS heptosyltransferase
VDYYWNLASHLLGEDPVDWSIHTPASCTDLPLALPMGTFMELGSSDSDRSKAAEIIQAAHLKPGERYAVLNPGGNNIAKRWPIERFAQLADHLHTAHNLRILINGSPAEADLCESIIRAAKCYPVSLPALGNTLGALKPIIDGATIMVTNDTGPRHIAAALSTPLITLFGPTDPRWTTIPTTPLPDGSPSETILVADPTLPASESANDQPQRCAIENIKYSTVQQAADDLIQKL